MENSFFLIGGIGLGLLFGFLFAKLFFWSSLRKHRKDAVNQSKRTTLGFVSETLVPLAPEFPYQIKDLMFLGKGVDYLVFDGMSEGQLKEIVFLEVKTNKSTLNAREKMIQKAIQDKRVSYQILRMK